jgi:NAD-dependent DNA ligase
LATAWCNGLQSSCAHLQSSVEKLQASVTQRCVNSIPSSNFASFLEDVNDQVSSVTADVEFLEAMTTDTLSFEELLANCTELYKQTEAGISVLETQLVQYGYIPGSQQVVDPKHAEPFVS